MIKKRLKNHKTKSKTNKLQRIIAGSVIATQLFFPVSSSFISVANAQTLSSQFDLKDNQDYQTQIYKLKFGEDANTVAAKFNMNIAALMFLNSHRTFKNGFEFISEGDEIDVPLKPLKKFEMYSDDSKRIADLMSQSGKFLADNPNSSKAGQLAGNILTNQLSAQTQQQLSQFGNARVKLDVDEDFSLKNSQIELLMPLWEQGDYLLFNQSSLHRTDDRNQINMGTGIRYFDNSYMVGGNVFYDYDLSHYHSRLGLGLEYWRDYFKFGLNSYLRLSNWRDSKDFQAYEERAANGWDVRMEGYLPTYPQLGGKLVFEKYYGDEVALFGKDNRQKDPHAFTVGLNYTPVPLVSLNAEHRLGQDNQNDSLFGIQFNYQLGVPLAQQLDGKSVAQLRSLMGSRYDFVARNNNIVLEYRKKEVIRLRTVESVTGQSGEQHSLNVSVNSEYGLDRIVWDSAGIEAFGGEIVAEGKDQYSVILPTYRPTAGESNSYTLTAIAYDAKGNSSQRAYTQIFVTQSLVDSQKSTFTPANATLPADGVSQLELTLTLLDKNSTPVDIPATEININIDSKNRSTGATVSGLQKTGTGIYTLTIQSGVIPQIVTLTPVIGSTTLAPVVVDIQATAISPELSSFTATPQTITANGQDATTLTLTAKDAQGEAVTELANISFAISGVENTTISNITENDGVFTATLTGTKAGIATIVPQIENSPISGLTATVELIESQISDEQSSFIIEPTTIVASDSNNPKEATFVFTAKDSDGKLMTGLTNVTFDIALDGQWFPEETPPPHLSEVTENNGVYSAKFYYSRRGTHTITPKVGDLVLTQLSAPIHIVTDVINEERSYFGFVNDKDQIIADGQDSTTIMVQIFDHLGNPFEDKNVSFSVTGVDGITIGNVRDMGYGAYEADLSGITAGTAIISTQVDGVGLQTQLTLTLTPKQISVTKSTIKAEPVSIIANGEEVSTLTFTAIDTEGHAMTGLSEVAFSVAGVSDIIFGEVTETDGVYVATLTGTKTGIATITPMVEGNLVNGLSTTVELIAGDISSERSTFMAEPPVIAANGQDTATVTFIPKDVNDNAIIGLTALSFSTIGLDDVTVSEVTEASGVYTATLTGTKSGTAAIIPLINGVEISGFSTMVELKADSISSENSTFTVEPTTINADGKDYATLTFTAKDSKNNPVIDLTDIAFVVTGISDTTVSAISEDSGVYTATLTGLSKGTATITVTSNGISHTALDRTVTLIDEKEIDPTQSILTVSKNTIIGDGTDEVTTTVTLKNSKGDLITGLDPWDVPIYQDFLSGKLIIAESLIEEISPGIYSGTTFAFGEGQLQFYLAPFKDTLSATVNVAEPAIDTAHSTFTATPDKITADGQTKATIKFFARSQNDGQIVYLDDRLTFEVMDLDGTIVTQPADIIEGSGIYQAELSGTIAGIAKVTPVLDGKAISELSTSVTLVAGPVDSSKSSLQATSDKILSNGSDTSTLTFSPIDNYDNPITNANVAFVTSGVNNITISDVVENSGVYTATLTGTNSGKASITVNVNGINYSELNSIVTLAGEKEIDPTQSTFAVSNYKIIGDGRNQQTATLTAKNIKGDLITGLDRSSIIKYNLLNEKTFFVIPEIQEASPGIYVAKYLAFGDGQVKLYVESFEDSLFEIITIIQPDLDINKSHFEALPEEIIADGVNSTTLAFYAVSKDGGQIVWLEDNIKFEATGLDGIIMNEPKEVQEGTGLYETKLSGTVPGVVTITPFVNGKQLTEMAVNITLTAP